MPTLSDMVTEVTQHLTGWGVDREGAGTLTAAMTVSALTATVSGSALTAGAIEIDDELMDVSAYDANTGIATIPPWGRGSAGSVAAAHAVNARVTTRPRYPRARVKTIINQVIQSLYPILYAVKVDQTIVLSSTKSTYGLPADAISVLHVSYESPVVNDTWLDVTRYRVDKKASVADYPTGSSLEIRAGGFQGRTLKVVYAATPSPLVNLTDDFSVTGLPPGSDDVVTLGAAARMLSGLEASRSDPFTVEQSNRTEVMPPGQASSASKYLMALYSQRLAQEQMRLQHLYPLRLRKAY